MQTLELDARPSPLTQYLAALRASNRRTESPTRLPSLQLVRPQVTLSARHIARYAEVCGFKPSQGVPLTYPHMLAFPFHMELLCSREFPFPVIGTVHLANAIEQHQPLQAGDKVRVEVEFGDLLAHDKGQVFEIRSRILRGSTLVWSSVSTNLRLGISSPKGRPFTSRLGENVTLVPQTQWYADAGIGRRYGRVSGDMNPIHLSALTAKLFGFKRAIAHGMWTKAKALSCMLPNQPLERARAQVEFKTPLFLPAKVSLWSGAASQGSLFEVRNEKGDKPHLRGHVEY